MKNLFQHTFFVAIALALVTTLSFASCSSDDNKGDESGGRTLTVRVTCNDPKQTSYVTFDVEYEVTVIDSDDIYEKRENVNSGWTLDVKCPEDAVALQFLADAKLTKLATDQGIKLVNIAYTVDILENGKVLKSDDYFHVVTYGIY